MSVLNGDGACITAWKMVKYLGVRFTVNSRGEPLFVSSKESRFPANALYVVSPFYPSLFGKLRNCFAVTISDKLKPNFGFFRVPGPPCPIIFRRGIS